MIQVTVVWVTQLACTYRRHPVAMGYESDDPGAASGATCASRFVMFHSGTPRDDTHRVRLLWAGMCHMEEWAPAWTCPRRTDHP